MFSNRTFQLLCNYCIRLNKTNWKCHRFAASDTQENMKRKYEVEGGDKKLNKAMKAYLERARTYNAFIKKEEDEFRVGKRHLANMMGCDPETFTQEQVDEAIAYLFPSGLFQLKARPLMKPPTVLFPPKKEAQFDESGRPFHFLFYTGKPNFYSFLHNMVKHYKALDKFEDDLNKQPNASSPEINPLEIEGSDWLSKEELEVKLVEPLHDMDYKNFVSAMGRLAEHRYAYRVKDFIMNLRKPLMDAGMNFSEVIKPSIDSLGREFITTLECPRKDARADVTVRRPGTGIININGKGIEYFTSVQSRGQILYPLELTGLIDTVDVEASVRGGGETGQAGAVRWGIAWGLRSFVSPDMIETMRLAGLLTRDFRRRERKKPGQEKARKKFTWKKR